MKQILTATFIFICSFIFSVQNYAAVITAPHSNETIQSQHNNRLTKALDKADLEKQLGRKLKLKEKIALRLFKKSAQRNKNTAISANENAVKMDGLAIAGFVCGVVGIFFAGIILGILAIVFGGVSLARIKQKPDTRKGKGFAIAAMVLGIVAIVGALIALSIIFG